MVTQGVEVGYVRLVCDVADGFVILSCLYCLIHTHTAHTLLMTSPVIVNNRLHKRDASRLVELKKLMIFILDTHVSLVSTHTQHTHTHVQHTHTILVVVRFKVAP